MFELAPTGVFAGTVTIASGVIPGDPVADPDAIGARYLDLHERRDRAEEVVGDLDAFRALVAAVGGDRPLCLPATDDPEPSRSGRLRPGWVRACRVRR